MRDKSTEQLFALKLKTNIKTNVCPKVQFKFENVGYF